MDITKKQLKYLIEDVVLAYKDKYLTKYIDTDDKKFRHDVLLAKFSIMFFDKNSEKLHHNFLNLLQFYEELLIPYENVKYAIADFFKIYQKWIITQKITKKSYYEKVKKVYIGVFNEFCKNYKKVSTEELEDDEFFFIEDEGVDDSIETMHYEDEEKISAKEYFEENPIDNEDLEDIVVARNSFEEILDNYLEYDDNFVEDFRNTLQRLNTALSFTFSTKEFKDIGDALENLFFTLENIHGNSEEIEKLAYNILITFIEDLIKWIESVFIIKSAVDIHYLDASLFANISQFKIIIEKEIT